MKKYIILLSIMLFQACAGSPKHITEYYVDGKLDRVVIEETTPQVEYYKTVRYRDKQVSQSPPLFDLGWKKFKISAVQTVILPNVKFYGEQKREKFERTPTGAEVARGAAKDAINPLNIMSGTGGAALIINQGKNTTHSVENVSAGGDYQQSQQGASTASDRSTTTKMTDVGNTKDSHNSEISTVETTTEPMQ